MTTLTPGTEPCCHHIHTLIPLTITPTAAAAVVMHQDLIPRLIQLLAHQSYTNVHLHHHTTGHIPTSHKYINPISAHQSFNNASSMGMLTPWPTSPTIMAGAHHFLHLSWRPIGISPILSCLAIQFITQILFTIL